MFNNNDIINPPNFWLFDGINILNEKTILDYYLVHGKFNELIQFNSFNDFEIVQNLIKFKSEFDNNIDDLIYKKQIKILFDVLKENNIQNCKIKVDCFYDFDIDDLIIVYEVYTDFIKDDIDNEKYLQFSKIEDGYFNRTHDISDKSFQVILYCFLK